MKLFAVAVAFALALAGCAGVAPSPVAPEPTTTPPAEEAAPSPTPAQETAAGVCDGSLEGCFGYEDMDRYVEAITPMVAEFFHTAYPDVSEPRDIVYIPNGRVARTFCGVSDSQAYEYCGADNTIHVGQDLIWAFYRTAGDAAPAIALAHEWGHHLQNMLGVPFARTRGQAIAFENQADCISGAWARFAGEQGWLETEDDIADATLLLDLIGSREGRGRDHGTSEERTRAFRIAFEDGIEACNEYIPDVPLA